MCIQLLSIASSSKLNAIIETGKDCNFDDINNEQSVLSRLIAIEQNPFMNDISYCIEPLRNVFHRLLTYPPAHNDGDENPDINRLFDLLTAEPNTAVILLIGSSSDTNQRVEAILVGSCQLARKVLTQRGRTIQPKSCQNEIVMPHNNLHLSVNHQTYAKAVISGISFVIKHLKDHQLNNVFLVPDFYNVAALLFLNVLDAHGNKKEIVISCSEDVGKSIERYCSNLVMPYIGISR